MFFLCPLSLMIIFHVLFSRVIMFLTNHHSFSVSGYSILELDDVIRKQVLS